jgi:hypothetical protein
MTKQLKFTEAELRVILQGLEAVGRGALPPGHGDRNAAAFATRKVKDALGVR